MTPDAVAPRRARLLDYAREHGGEFATPGSDGWVVFTALLDDLVDAALAVPPPRQCGRCGAVLRRARERTTCLACQRLAQIDGARRAGRRAP